MSSLDKHVISKPQPFRCAILIICTAIITYACQWYFIQQDLNYQESITNEQLSDKILQLNTKNTNLHNTITDQERNIAIQQATNIQLQEQFNRLQNKVISLKKELVFYQTINQGSSTSKLTIRDLHLRADETQPDLFLYRLVISQGKKITSPISGTVFLTLNSLHHDKEIQSEIGEHSLALRHVQILEGQIKLADKTEPTSITVVLKQNKTTLTKTFDWQLNSD